MKAWFSAAELAGLPGLPGSARGVQIRAKRAGWKARPRKGRGGGFEYHAEALAVEARVALGIELVNGASDRSAVADSRAAQARSDAARKRAALQVVAELKGQVRSVIDALEGMVTMLDRLEGGLRKGGLAGGNDDPQGYAENIAEHGSS
ncbi:DNA-binding protein [Xanthobacter flavus]|uniref:DNA-binding protein n=1 Tax=Xanthobacter flavus TaxID=281 RepID=UPI00372A905D